MPKFQVNAPLECDGKSYQIGEEFDPTGMKTKDVRFLVQSGVLLAVEEIQPIVIKDEEETWPEQP